MLNKPNTEMETYKNITEASIAAELFFKENFDHDEGVGIESKNGNTIEFYSKEDPGMSDTFICQIE